MNNISKILFPNITHDITYYENKYPVRCSNVVTRFAPSPTGYVHIGSLFSAFINYKYAKDKNGKYILRIEDTDQKRLVVDSIETIVNDLNNFNILPDEGIINVKKETGLYGPYCQSKRLDIYHTFAKYLIDYGKAYPCFCSDNELNNLREKQETNKQRIGYYGKYAKCRNLTNEEIINKINNGNKFVIRLKSNGDFNKKINFKDLVKGEITFHENDLDIILIKSDGYPTYHFAHLVDDYLMQVTHIIRGDEWLSSLPIHYQLFQTFNFKIPKYAHISPLMKKEDGFIRKISKRKDPEAKVSYYFEKGIPYEAVKIYLMTIANSNFEGFYESNKNINEFKFELNKMSKSGAIFDIEKLLNISKNYLSKLSAKDIYNNLLNYTKIFDKEFYLIISKNKDYTIRVLNIERNRKKSRKDYAMYSEIKNNIYYMYDCLFNYDDVLIKEYYNIDILNTYIEKYYNEMDDKETWYQKLKDLGESYNFAKEVRDYKNNPNKYKGHIGDICELLRVAITSKINTPDLYEIMQVIGKNRVIDRINMFNKYIKGK